MKEVFIDDALSEDGLRLLAKKCRKQGSLRIALLATESHKDVMAKFVQEHRAFFCMHTLQSTAETGKHIRKHLDIDIESVGHGPDGGDVIIAYRILNRECDVLFFFRSGKEVLPHDSDIQMLFRVAIMSNCVLAQNAATAELIVVAFQQIFDRLGKSDEGARV